MGLLGRLDIHAKWIGFDPPTASESAASALLGGAQWIWFPGGQPQQSAPVGNCFFQHSFDMPALAKVRKAVLRFTADNSAELFVNGKKAGAASDFHAASEVDVTGLLKNGTNLLAASVSNAGTDPNPAGLIVFLQVEFNQGDPLEVVTDSKWFTSTSPMAGWQSNHLDHASWQSAQTLGPPGCAPWGKITGPEDRRLQARYLRREFEIEKVNGNQPCDGSLRPRSRDGVPWAETRPVPLWPDMCAVLRAHRANL
jgi:alpha-L-rhamnosidase